MTSSGDHFLKLAKQKSVLLQNALKSHEVNYARSYRTYWRNPKTSTIIAELNKLPANWINLLLSDDGQRDCVQFASARYGRFLLRKCIDAKLIADVTKVIGEKAFHYGIEFREQSDDDAVLQPARLGCEGQEFNLLFQQIVAKCQVLFANSVPSALRKLCFNAGDHLEFRYCKNETLIGSEICENNLSRCLSLEIDRLFPRPEPGGANA